MNVWIFLIVALNSISGSKLISEAASVANYGTGKGKYPPLCVFKLCVLPSKTNFDVIVGGTADSDHYNAFARPSRNFVVDIIYFVVNRNKVNKVVKSADKVAESAPVTEAIEAEKDNERKQNEGSSRPKREICFFKMCSMNPPSVPSTTSKPN
ncbi:hypothetical protein TSAR_016798 [Trichomalopsis sarcophagae]|uniref:Uncharacterized protein n=1 Tax=Trichomalopsis sarcophagae TaxID=543379 RepID=A0A232EVL3_9HYME|nr:hypothetical protein TSAR_016798 [Trichomalopsis sarcophagae]